MNGRYFPLIYIDIDCLDLDDAGKARRMAHGIKRNETDLSPVFWADDYWKIPA